MCRRKQPVERIYTFVEFGKTMAEKLALHLQTWCLERLGSTEMMHVATPQSMAMLFSVEVGTPQKTAKYSRLEKWHIVVLD